jgi:hypothetical protein
MKSVVATLLLCATLGAASIAEEDGVLVLNDKNFEDAIKVW